MCDDHCPDPKPHRANRRSSNGALSGLAWDLRTSLRSAVSCAVARMNDVPDYCGCCCWAYYSHSNYYYYYSTDSGASSEQPLTVHLFVDAPPALAVDSETETGDCLVAASCCSADSPATDGNPRDWSHFAAKEAWHCSKDTRRSSCCCSCCCFRADSGGCWCCCYCYYYCSYSGLC